MSNIKNKHFTNSIKPTIIYGNKRGIYMKVVLQLNYSCNNIIPDEKFQRAIVMFTNRNEDFETLKQIIDWYVQNERARYIEHLKRKRNYERVRKNKYNQNITLQRKKVA